MAKVVKFPVIPPKKLGARKVRKRKRDRMEDMGQLNLFDQSKIIAFQHAGNFFEEALALDERNDPRAEELYLKAISQRQSVADAHCNLGILMSHQHKLTEAIDHLTICLKEDPRHFEAHYNLANVYSDTGNLELAKIHYTVAIEIEPEFPNSHYNLGLVHISLKNYKEAIPCINNYIELSPESDHAVAIELLKTLTSIAQ